jgi:D-3-phosphoglycerate dehydrogenase
MAKIFVASLFDNPQFRSPRRAELMAKLGTLGELVPEPASLGASDAPGMVASIASSSLYTDEFYAAADQLRVVARWGVGFDQVNVAGATRAGVLVCIAPVHADTVAEYSIAQWLAVLKRVYTHNAMAHAGDFGLITSYDAQSSTLGLYGCGRIGQEVAKRAQGLLGPQGRLLIHDVRPDVAQIAARYGAEVVDSPAELFERADVVSVHVAGAEPIIDYALLSHLRPHASLINPSRGNLVDDVGMARALQEGKLFYYVLDEPPNESRTIHAGNPRVIMTNHTAGVTLESAERLDAATIGQVEAALQGRCPDHVLNPDVLQHPRVLRWLRA